MSTKPYLNALAKRQALKVIAGINNVNVEDVISVAESAAKAGAHAVDISADAAVVSAVVALNLPITIVASSVNPVELAKAVHLGAHVAELGNFDALYEQGWFFSAEQVLALATEAKALLDNTPLCVTIPGHLASPAQQSLTKALTRLGVSMLQTEGAVRLLVSQTVQALTASEKVAITLSNTRLIADATHLPVLTASGLNVSNLADAFAAGASGVGVGQAVRQTAHRTEAVKALMAAIPEAVALMAKVS